MQQPQQRNVPRRITSSLCVTIFLCLCFPLKGMVERLAVMLNFNLKQLCGPENKGLIVSEGGTQAGREECVCTGR